MDDTDSDHGQEAEAQREQTVMPWVWGAVGVLAVAAFCAWMFLQAPQSHIRHPAAAAPTMKPAAQHD